MIFLVIVILLNVVNSVLFKLFPKFKIDTLQAIVANYVVCVITGSLYLGHFPVSTASSHESWFPFALLMGASFISIFNLLAYCTRTEGITTATIANKLSLVIPALLSVALYNESLNAGKITGIILALPAVYLTTRVKEENKKAHNFYIPALLFILSGLLDSFVRFVQFHYLADPGSQAVFTIHAFAAAASIGILVVTTLIITKKMQFHWRNIIAGICLGVPNYFSIYLFIRLLHSNFLQSSSAIPVTNIGIVVISTLTAILLFKEKLTLQRIIGLLLAIIAILLIAINGRSI